MSPSTIRKFIVALAFAGLFQAPAFADSSDPAASRITSFYGSLLDTMKQAKQLGVKGRYDKLSPVLAKTYDLPSMSKLAVGPSWSALTPQQQAANSPGRASAR